jgi:hypothetical protein
MAVSHWIEAQTGWSIKKFVRAARRYGTVTSQAGSQTLTAGEPPPPDLAEALTKFTTYLRTCLTKVVIRTRGQRPKCPLTWVAGSGLEPLWALADGFTVREEALRAVSARRLKVIDLQRRSLGVPAGTGVCMPSCNKPVTTLTGTARRGLQLKTVWIGEDVGA